MGAGGVRWRQPAPRTLGGLRVALLLTLSLLVACAGKPTKPVKPTPVAAQSSAPAPTPGPAPAPAGGGLYAPHIQDGGPPIPADVSGIAEPVPIAEPLARYGNRSPYTVLGKSYQVMNSADGHVERGIASWYGTKFHGRPTSSFEPYDMYKLTAAHKSLPLPSFVRVTNLENGRSLVVRVNDRGPFHDDRIIDLSYAAAVRLGVHIKGTAQVEVRALVATGAASRTAHSMEPSRPFGVASNSRRWLQVGSFGERNNARAVERQLSDAGIRHHRSLRADVAGRPVWRVQVGPLGGHAEFEHTQSKLRQLGFGAPQLVYD